MPQKTGVFCFSICLSPGVWQRGSSDCYSWRWITSLIEEQFCYGNWNCARVKFSSSCRQSRDMIETERHSHGVAYWKDRSKEKDFKVCVCTEQTRLLNLCRAAEAGSSSSQREPFTYPFWSLLSFPRSESSGFLFSRSSAYHLFLHCCPHSLLPILLVVLKWYFGG